VNQASAGKSNGPWQAIKESLAREPSIGIDRVRGWLERLEVKACINGALTRHLADRHSRFEALAHNARFDIVRPAAAPARTLDYLNAACETVHPLFDRSTL
jgi:hypothetical protein